MILPILFSLFTTTWLMLDIMYILDFHRTHSTPYIHIYNVYIHVHILVNVFFIFFFRFFKYIPWVNHCWPFGSVSRGGRGKGGGYGIGKSLSVPLSQAAPNVASYRVNKNIGTWMKSNKSRINFALFYSLAKEIRWVEFFDKLDKCS